MDMRGIYSKIVFAAGKKRVKQVGSLYLSMVVSLIIGIGVSVLNTRFLGKEIYGDLKFIQNLFSFALTFVTIGLFYSGGRLIAKKKHSDLKNKLFGSLILLSFAMFVVLLVFFVIFSFPQEKLFDNNLGYIIRLFSPFLFIFPLQLCFESVLQGDNRIYTLSIFRLGPKLFYLLTVLVFTYFFSFTLTTALTFHFASIFVLIVLVVSRLKPSFRKLNQAYNVLWNENRTYGFPVYTGAIASVASTQIAGLTISYFIDNTHVGFFYLAVTATMPLSMIPNTAGITFFKDFVNMNVIPRRVFLLTLLFTLVALFGFLLIIKPLVIFLYTEEYLAVVPLAYYIAVAAIFQGVGDFFNRYISAHGLGNKLRNSSFILGAFNILGYTLLVYKFGVEGAAITRLIAGILYLGLMIKIYWNFKSKNG